VQGHGVLDEDDVVEVLGVGDTQTPHAIPNTRAETSGLVVAKPSPQT
jgi:hypothetical protein